jgi:hypothetical protein
MNVGWNYTRLNSCYSQLFFSCEGHHKVEVWWQECLRARHHVSAKAGIPPQGS